MKIKESFSYRNNLQHEWILPLIDALAQIPDDIFFHKDGSPLKTEVPLDKRLINPLKAKFGSGVEHNFKPMIPENQFTVDFVLPTNPATLIEIEKGKLPRLELDIMKIINSIYRFPSKYGFGCIIVPINYIQLNLAGNRSPYQYVKNNLIPLNSFIIDCKGKDGSFLIKDFLAIGYFDPRGK